MYGSIALNFSLVNVSELVDLSISPLSSQIRDKEIELSINVDKDNQSINIDIEKTTWVLVNLLGNAIRYTPRWGSIALQAKQEKNNIVISVKNSGEGIEEEYLADIFESLVKNSKNPNKVGRGLALTISKEIIEAHNGTMSVESKLGRGTTFIITLPLSNTEASS